jgi:hypothetical protein
MKKSTVYKVILSSIFLYGIIALIKAKYFAPSLSESFIILWSIDIISFSLSFAVPLIIGINYDKINELKNLINDLKENSSINHYDTFNHIYNQIGSKSNNLKKYKIALAKEYLSVRFIKPFMDFFYFESEELFYETPYKIKPIFNKIIEILNEIELKIKKENLTGEDICPQEDRIELVEKVLSIACFYNFYYPIKLDESILILFDKFKRRLNIKESFSNISFAVALNNFKFNSNLVNSEILNSKYKDDLLLYFKIQSNSIQLAKVVNSLNQDFNYKQIVKFYDEFFEIKKYIRDDDLLLNLIFDTELLSFFDYLKSSFSKVAVDNRQKKNLYKLLNISSTRILEDKNNLGDFIMSYFRLKFRIDINDYLNNVFSKNINRELIDNYHPLFNLYFSLNSTVSTGINYSPKFKGIDNVFHQLKPEYIKDIHVWYINKMNGLIGQDNIEQAKVIYNEIDFDKVYYSISNDVVYKYSMLICKAVFLNRLEDNYKESIELLNEILRKTKLHSDLRDVKYLLFIFAFEKKDRIIYRAVYESSNKEERAIIIQTANWIRMFDKVDFLHIGNWLYVSYPVLNGYLIKDNKIPLIINGG